MSGTSIARTPGRQHGGAGAAGSGPRIGFTVPGWSIRALFAAIALGLCLVEAAPGFWLSVAILLGAAAVVAPRWLTAWFLIGVLAFTVLLVPTATIGLRALLLVAGLHALHLCGSWMLVVPATARVQPRALWPSARRFLIIQLPVQAATAGALWLSGASRPSAVPFLAAIAGAAVVALVVVLAAPLVRRPRD